MKKIIFAAVMVSFPYFALAQSADLAAGITGELEQENLIETVKEEEQVTDDRGIFGFLNFSFIKKSSEDTKEEKEDGSLFLGEETVENVDSTTNAATADAKPAPAPKKETPLERMIRLAENGNIDSQLSLGYMYLYGEKGVKSDYKKAFHYYELAAKQNNPVALNNLGSLYFSGIGTEVNYQKAAELFLKSAQNGSDDAAVNLAFIYLTSSNENKSHDYAINLFEEAAKVGNNTAKFMLGYAYYTGYIVEQDYYKAFTLIKESAAAKFDIAQYMLGYMYSKGYGIAKNYGNAVKYYRLAVSQGNVPAMVELADIYAKGTMYPQNIISAYVLYSMASFYGAENADVNRDKLEPEIKLEELLPAQTNAEKFKEQPSELTTYIRNTYGPDVRVYIDKNLVKGKNVQDEKSK